MELLLQGHLNANEHGLAAKTGEVLPVANDSSALPGHGHDTAVPQLDAAQRVQLLPPHLLFEAAKREDHPVRASVSGITVEGMPAVVRVPSDPDVVDYEVSLDTREPQLERGYHLEQLSRAVSGSGAST